MLKVMKQYHEILGPCPDSFEDNLRRIETAGRVCYQSQDKITDDSYIKFCNMLTEAGHWAMLEHSNLVIKVRYRQSDLDDSNFITRTEEGRTIYYAGNYRAFMEALGYSSLYDLKRLSSVQITQAEAPRNCTAITVVFHTNRSNSHELVRHRPASYAQLSQRYVSHTDRMKVILPVQYYDKTQMNPKYDVWYEAMEFATAAYRKLRAYKETPQQARNVLPNSVHTQIAVTANLPEWNHIFNLRCSAAADPQMQDLMKPVEKEFCDKGWI